MYAQTKTLTLPLLQKISTRTLFFVLSGILVTLFLTYAYLVNKTIMNVVAREHTQQSITQRSTALGDLESKYLSLKNGVTLDLAYAKGFKDASPQFIARGGSLAFNTSH